MADAPIKGPEPRGHHYVPKCYLAGFTDDGTNDGRLFVTDLKRQKDWPTNPAEAAKQRDFNRLSDEFPNPLAAENAYADIESEIAEVFRSLYKFPRLPIGEELGVLLYFAALQACRVPIFRDFARQVIHKMATSARAEMLRTPEIWAETLRTIGLEPDSPGADYQGALEFHQYCIESGGEPIKVRKDWQIKKGFESAIDVILPSMKKRNWEALISPNGNFITSDNPVMVDGSESGKLVGYENAEFVLYPVNRKLLLAGTLEPTFHRLVTANVIALHNSITMTKAESQVYSHRPDFYCVDESGHFQTDWHLFSK